MFSLPFCSPNQFDIVFEKIKSSLKKDGIFCGQFFGINDDWSKKVAMTFHTKIQVENLLKDWKIIHFKEVDTDDFTANNTPKHWHFFEVIAKKQA